MFEVTDWWNNIGPITQLAKASIKGSGFYLLINSLVKSIYTQYQEPGFLKVGGQQKNYLAHEVSNIVYWSKVQQDKNTLIPKLRIAAVPMLKEPCIVVPFDFGDKPNDDSKTEGSQCPWKQCIERLIVEPSYKWKEACVDAMEARLDKKIARPN